MKKLTLKERQLVKEYAKKLVGKRMIKENYQDHEENLNILKKWSKSSNHDKKKYALEILEDNDIMSDENEVDEAVEMMLDTFREDDGRYNR